MQKKVLGIAADLAARIEQWPGVSGVVLGEIAAVETIDPYFSIEMAVYHHGSLPSVEDRKERLGSPAGFEYSPQQMADLFLVTELPVRIFYRTRDRLEAMLERVEQGKWVFRNETTQVLYRIQTGKTLYDREGWVERSRARLNEVPEALWSQLKEGSRVAVDRALRDVGAAVYRDDHLYYLLASARFLQNLCSFLYALNRKFEPTQQLLLERVIKLDKLPAEFSGRFDMLIRPEITPSRRYEICQLIAKSLSYL